MIAEQVDMAIQEGLLLAEPQISYDFFKIVPNAENKKILVGKNRSFSGKYIFDKLEKAEEVVVAVLTVGGKIENKSACAFTQGDYLLGMIYDAIGSAALENLKKHFFKELCKKIGAEKKGITCGLSPGSNEWNIQDQAIVFELVDGKTIGVTLNESMMMIPVKSISVVYGIGEELNMLDYEHDCARCNLTNCQFRVAQ